MVEAAGSSSLAPAGTPPFPGGPGSEGPSPLPGSPGPPSLAFTFPSPRDQISSDSLGLQAADAAFSPCTSPAASLCPPESPQGREGTPGRAHRQDSIPRSGRIFISWVNRRERVLGRGKEGKPALWVWGRGG